MAFRHVLPGLMLAGFMLAAAGCQSSDSGTVLESASADVPPPSGKVTESELLAYCPRVTLREGTAYFNTYAKGGDGDPSKVLYQASITDVTRSCTRSGGMLNLNVAVAGKIVPGPSGALGNITMPIRVAVVQGGTVLYSELRNHTVAVGDASVATQFVFNDPNISIPDPTARDIQVFAGYDEGPPKQTAAVE